MEWTTEMIEAAFNTPRHGTQCVSVTVIGEGEASNVRTLHPHDELVCLFGGALVIRRGSACGRVRAAMIA
jgi:hypothetical protein